MSNTITESIEFALNSNRIRPLAKRFERILLEPYDVEGYLTEESGYPQLVLQKEKDGKALVLELKSDDQESDCLWMATRYYRNSTDTYLWKRDIINQILWLISEKTAPPVNSEGSLIKSQRNLQPESAKEPIRGNKSPMSNNNNNPNNKLAHVRDVFDILFRIMDEEGFPKESRMDLINMGVTEFLGLKSFNSIFENIQKKRETNALSSKISQLEDLVKRLATSPATPPSNSFTNKKSPSSLINHKQEEEDDEYENEEMSDFDRELENLDEEE